MRYRIRKIVAIVLVFGFAAVSGCSKNGIDTPIQIAGNDALIRPAHFPEAHYKHTTNVYSKAGYELGKRLFSDPLLSINNSVSCASCHKQQYAFSDAGVVFSRGINGLTGRRHSPPIFNMAWTPGFMWDGGVNHLEVMPLSPLTNPVEMGETLSDIVRKLNHNTEYPAMFQAVFHKDTIDDQQLFWALAQYMSNLVSADSKYDKVVKRQTVFTSVESEGYILYQQYCSACHTEPLFTNYSFQNNGIDITFKDSGRFRITQNAEDMGKFKVPSLRNIAVTAPYMHDGRFTTLESVLQHYANGVLPSSTLSPLMMKNGNPGLLLTDEEQKKLIIFLQALTDSTFIGLSH